MQPDFATARKLLSNDFVDAMIRVGLIAMLVILCVNVFAPFLGLMVWALILAIALYPLHRIIARRLGGRQGSAATLLIVSGLLVIGWPTLMLGGSFANHAHDAYQAIENNAITINQPDASVAEWPLVGKRIYSSWSKAADNLPAYLKKHQPEIKKLSKWLLHAAANTAGSVLLFLGSLIIAGIMMAYAESGSQAMQKIFSRLTGPVKGPQLQSLSTATVRSVATGVIGVAFIQALLLGIGFIMADIPAAGVLAIVVLLLGIVQVPATVISIPVIAYIWWSGDASTTSNVFYTIYLLVAGLADNVLKPFLLGRGVDAPMPVILFGALGGMVWSGIIGLFIGAVVLAIGYQIFMDWVNTADQAPAASE